jgi:asparagine synthase (glutamine-hydrolysing)
LKKIRELLTAAVKKRLMADVPFGLLISGGVDSSIIAAIAVRLHKEIALEQGIENPPKLLSFCIGL